jgi:hypothetical protein
VQNSGVSSTATTERKLAFGACPAFSLVLARKLRDNSRSELTEDKGSGPIGLGDIPI